MKVIYVSRKDDFAILKVEGSNLPPALPICYSRYPITGEEVIALGSPRGLVNSISKGIVSAVRKTGSEYRNTEFASEGTSEFK